VVLLDAEENNRLRLQAELEQVEQEPATSINKFVLLKFFNPTHRFYR
jgi:hypothetical protein